MFRDFDCYAVGSFVIMDGCCEYIDQLQLPSTLSNLPLVSVSDKCMLLLGFTAL